MLARIIIVRTIIITTVMVTIKRAMIKNKYKFESISVVLEKKQLPRFINAHICIKHA